LTTGTRMRRTTFPMVWLWAIERKFFMSVSFEFGFCWLRPACRARFSAAIEN
jgi:hypothetical protein